MITNRVGCVPAVRQSVPQRQSVAFGGDFDLEKFEAREAGRRLFGSRDDEWEKKANEFLNEPPQPPKTAAVVSEKTVKLKQKSIVSKIASGIWSGYKEFAKADVAGLGHTILATIALVSCGGIQIGRERMAEHKVETVISDVQSRNRVFNNADLLENYNDCSSEKRDYLNQVVDSVRGGKSTPNKTFNIKYRRLEHNYEQMMQAKADSVNRMADSIYHVAGLNSPRMSKGYVPYVPKIK